MGVFSFIFSKNKNLNAESYLSHLDRQTAIERWEKVEEQLRLGKPSNYRSAVIEADKILEFVLSKIYPRLSSTGERLKEAKPKFINNYEIYDGIWYAHKVRNELVHNINFELPSVQVRDVIDKFRIGLQFLGVL